MWSVPVMLPTTAGVRSAASAPDGAAAIAAAAVGTINIHGFMIVISFASADADQANVRNRAVLFAERRVDANRIRNRRGTREEHGFRARRTRGAARHHLRVADGRGAVEAILHVHAEDLILHVG